MEYGFRNRLFAQMLHKEHNSEHNRNLEKWYYAGMFNTRILWNTTFLYTMLIKFLDKIVKITVIDFPSGQIQTSINDLLTIANLEFLYFFFESPYGGKLVFTKKKAAI